MHNLREENRQEAFCIIGRESRGIRISSRNNERIETIMKKLQDWFCIKLYIIFLVPNLLHFYLYGSRNIISTKPYFQCEEITTNFSYKIQNHRCYLNVSRNIIT